mmetsp:Transcript_39309/g.123991  ORF Transcript_39309/g.123991 Transcript_39309/m.123991 type:complete len:244 (-) Transcript_39309:73-804(-)
MPRLLHAQHAPLLRALHIRGGRARAGNTAEYDVRLPVVDPRRLRPAHRPHAVHPLDPLPLGRAHLRLLLRDLLAGHPVVQRRPFGLPAAHRPVPLPREHRHGAALHLPIRYALRLLPLPVRLRARGARLARLPALDRPALASRRDVGLQVLCALPRATRRPVERRRLAARLRLRARREQLRALRLGWDPAARNVLHGREYCRAGHAGAGAGGNARGASRGCGAAGLADRGAASTNGCHGAGWE